MSKIEDIVSEHVRKVLELWSRTPNAPSFGQEIEFSYSHYLRDILLSNVKMSIVRCFRPSIDGTLLVEVRTPPIHVHDLGSLRSVLTLLALLAIPIRDLEETLYVGVRGLSNGNHLHLKPSIDTRRALYRTFMLLIPLLPACVSAGFRFRSTVTHYAEVPHSPRDLEPTCQRKNTVVTYNPRWGTIEVRLFESSPLDAYVVALALSELLEKYEEAGEYVPQSFEEACRALREAYSSRNVLEVRYVTESGGEVTLIEGLDRALRHLSEVLNHADVDSTIPEIVDAYREVTVRHRIKLWNTFWLLYPPLYAPPVFYTLLTHLIDIRLTLLDSGLSLE